MLPFILPFKLLFTLQVMQQLDDHIVLTQSMTFSPFKKPFEERILKWEQQLNLVCCVGGWVGAWVLYASSGSSSFGC